jgi:hypothetical protein
MNSTHQSWCRDYSQRLANSYESSAKFKHNLTIGQSREYQVLDVFRKLLPQVNTVEENVIIIDSAGNESSKFDGALVNHTLFPRLFSDGNVMAVMLESVSVAVEIKSSLNKDEIGDIFTKAAKLRRMKHVPSPLSLAHAIVVAFSYQCSNIALSFFDFCTAFYQHKIHSPSLVCVLNQGIFGFTDGSGVIGREPHETLMPAFYETSEDSLLVLLYYLSSHATNNAALGEIIIQYSRNLFEGVRSLRFGDDFAAALQSNPANVVLARQCFERITLAELDKAYMNARKSIGLP